MISTLKLCLEKLKMLEPGWGGYEEPAPILDSIELANQFLNVLEEWEINLPFQALLDHEGYAQLAYMTESEGDYFVMTFYAPDVCWYCFRPKGCTSEIQDIKLSNISEIQKIKIMLQRLCN